MPRWNANYVLQNHHFRPPRGYAPLAFKADEMKEVIQETMDVRVKFHDGYWKKYPTKVRPGSSRLVRTRF